MRLIRFQREEKFGWGILENEKVFRLEGDLYGDFKKGKELGAIQDVKLLAPADPTITVACGMNYAERLQESGWAPPAEPIIFFKPPSCIVGPDENIVPPAMARELRYEAELCAVIKKKARNVAEKDALDYVLGYTCGNELGAMDLAKKDKWLTRAKGFDTSGPLGPCLVTGLDPHHLLIQSRVNGETRQKENTNIMIFSVEKLVSYISEFMTLRPGDVIWTGTPKGAGLVKVGDVIEVEIEGIGVLKNKVVSSK